MTMSRFVFSPALWKQTLNPFSGYYRPYFTPSTTDIHWRFGFENDTAPSMSASPSMSPLPYLSIYLPPCSWIYSEENGKHQHTRTYSQPRHKSTNCCVRVCEKLYVVAKNCKQKKIQQLLISNTHLHLEVLIDLQRYHQSQL